MKFWKDLPFEKKCAICAAKADAPEDFGFSQEKIPAGMYRRSIENEIAAKKRKNESIRASFLAYRNSKK